MPPSTPPVPECLTRKPHPEVLRARHLSPSTPPGDLPRMLPSPPRVPRGRGERAPPGSSPSGPRPESPSRELSEWAAPREPPHRETTPGTRRACHVSPGVIPFSAELKYTEKQ